jgi:RNA-directed DNA polymerase
MAAKIAHSFEEIISVDNLLAAWGDFLDGKKKRSDVRLFSRALLHNILSLHGDLTAGTYHHSAYEAFTVNDPKPRNIHKATVRDRLLHHALYRLLYTSFDTSFIHDSYSCRDSKGAHKAFLQLISYSRRVSQNYTLPCFALKMDIRKFFNSIDHEILIGLLKKRVETPLLLRLLENIIRSFECSPGRGMPLGNLTSQLFANVYMDPLDKFVKHKLKVKYYLRYADDFLILSNSESELMGYFVEINIFLKNSLKLKLHPNKISLRKLSQGIDFVGYIALPHYELPRHKTVNRIIKKLKTGEREEIEKALPSYLGHLGHANSYKIRQKVVGLAPRFKV